jgi:hypothetical protein
LRDVTTVKKKRILDQVLGGSIRQGSELLYPSVCCGHHKSKLSVNIHKGAFKCWVCDYKGKSLRRLVRRYGDFNHVYQWREFEEDPIDSDLKDLFVSIQEIEQVVELPEEFMPLARPPRPTDNRARKYLKSRDINKQDILMWRLGYCSTGQYANRIIIPSFSDKGDCNYFVARSWDKSTWPPYLNGPGSKDIIFNDLLVDWDKEVTLVEGVFDAIAFGENAIPLLGSTLRDDSKLFHKIVSNDTPILMALDADAKDKSLKIIKSLLTYDIEVRLMETSGYKDIAEMPSEILKERARLAPFINTTNYLMQRASIL